MRKRQPAKTSPVTDPYADREAQKYDNPIPSREFILEKLSHVGKPLSFQSIAELFNLSDSGQLEALNRRLRAMQRDGQLIRNRRKGYGLAKKMNLVRGRIIGHPEGFGFLVPDEGGEDVFLPEKQMRSLLHGDRALVSISGIDHRGRREGVLVEVLERNTNEVVGRFFREKGVTFVEPDNKRIHQNILIPRGKENKAKQGQVVVARLVEQPDSHHPPVGQIIEVIGDPRAPGMEIDIAIRAHGLPCLWSEEVLNESKAFSKKIPASFLKSRHDLRQLSFVTIDGEDAHDFDDAVFCEPRGKGWRLLVAIADVSTYVEQKSAIDREAQNRGNSVYFPDRVIPMLPEVLSTQLCSLKPKVDRLAIVCELHIDMYGRTRRVHFLEAVIRSAARLTYTEVAAVLQGNEKGFKYPKLLPAIHHLYRLFQVLFARRQKRGAIDFESTETRILFNQQRKIDQIVVLKRTDAHRLIEEMMLAANVAAADWLAKQEIPTIYRIHEGPPSEKLADLQGFLKHLALALGGRKQPKASHFASLIEKTKHRDDAMLIQTMLLRSMGLAIYSPENKGHFGLAYETYTHFTSPIRRYPDLLVHRAIRHCLQGLPKEKFPYSIDKLASLAEHCSMTERRADEATRDAVNWLKCDYMQDKVGQEYDGLITGVTPFGIFVMLDNLAVEGLIHVTALKNDYYHFDPVGQCLCGEYSNTVYRLSDRLHVKIVRVDVEEKKIDFELA